MRYLTPAGAAPCSTILTPHDSALDKQDVIPIFMVGFNVKRVSELNPGFLLPPLPWGEVGAPKRSEGEPGEGVRTIEGPQPLTPLAIARDPLPMGEGEEAVLLPPDPVYNDGHKVSLRESSAGVF